MTRRRKSSTLFGMIALDEFQMTEDGARAIVETCFNLSTAVTTLSRELEELREAYVILDARFALMEQAMNRPNAWA